MCSRLATRAGIYTDTRAVNLSDGPAKSYQIGSAGLAFEHAALKESGIKLKECRMVVEALKSLGQEQITSEAISKIRGWLPRGQPQTGSTIPCHPSGEGRKTVLPAK